MLRIVANIAGIEKARSKQIITLCLIYAPAIEKQLTSLPRSPEARAISAKTLGQRKQHVLRIKLLLTAFQKNSK